MHTIRPSNHANSSPTSLENISISSLPNPCRQGKTQPSLALAGEFACLNKEEQLLESVANIRSAQSIAGAITRREEEKCTKCREQITGPDAKRFQSVVCETFGGCKKDSILLFKTVAERIAETVKTEFRILMTALSCSLQKSNARMLKSRMYDL
jgi:hypothetical protein